MALRLTDRETRLLTAAADAVLAPTAGESPDAWWRDVEERVRPLFPHANVGLGLPEGARLRILCASVDEARRRDLEGLLDADPRTGQFVVHCETTARMLTERRARGIRVWDEARNGAILRELGHDQRRAVFYNDGLVAAGMRDFSTIVSEQGSAELFLHVGYARTGRARADDAARLGLLLPALRVAHRAMRERAARDAGLAAMLDAVAGPALVVGPDGRERHRTAALLALLADEPARDAVLAAMHAAAASVRALHAGVHAAVVDAIGAERTVAGARRRYEVRARLAPPLVWGTPGTVLVALAPTAPTAAPDDALRARFGLTAREVEVARLLAQRLTNGEVAAALGVSAHTARHHTERVLQKLGARTRREAGTLLAALAPPPA